MSKARVITMRFECNGYHALDGKETRCINHMDIIGTIKEINEKFPETGWDTLVPEGSKNSARLASNADAHICPQTHFHSEVIPYKTNMQDGWKVA